MQILANADLSRFHTFSIEQTCQYLVEVKTVDDIKDVYQSSKWSGLPKLILGKGSNVLFTQPYQGVVVVNQLLGKSVTETDHHWHLHIAGGENWPDLVKWSVEKGYFGLENLALIPGCAGSAPIQNIGAYGVEFKDLCDYVEVLCLDTFTIKRLSAQQCQFSYRDSIFKHELYKQVIIVAIGIKLTKNWQANIEYGPLQSLATEGITAKQIFERVCQIRAEKLPDPVKIGNAGSFFKNPIISEQHLNQLQKKYPDIVAYAIPEGVKIAAGWLIDQCQLKGISIGGAQVHQKQALVLVNKNNATSEDVVDLAAKVYTEVLKKYQIPLEHEVRFIGSQAETNLANLIEKQ
ncbi:UDP-N-acetylmuramate dehydrogenase [Vibrio pectenicida]|uniref:UDP-N-acetylenolpyruvoylglucosamine reductase n=1 Tax=Vibrio pectenicida TaxID=62763 RepID=A0A427TZJ1_9VIBR|nr:UDP-N-acetylmuramate dehydrogenase [Vibrio pectenicida]RSD29871.1 UDP-N-acetylmuramate dehydrogenase [Vibrio pectenicida]